MNSSVYQNRWKYNLTLKLNYHQFIFFCTHFRTAFFFHWMFPFLWHHPNVMPRIPCSNRINCISSFSIGILFFLRQLHRLMSRVCFVPFTIILMDKFNYIDWEKCARAYECREKEKKTSHNKTFSMMDAYCFFIFFFTCIITEFSCLSHMIITSIDFIVSYIQINGTCMYIFLWLDYWLSPHFYLNACIFPVEFSIVHFI